MAEARFQSSETDALKVPPHSLEAEQAVLGGLMLDNGAWDQVADRVSEADFYRRDHRLIFRAVAALAEAGQPMDAVTLSEWLKSNGELEDAGGLPYLGALARDTPSSANIRAYADIVREKSVLRQLIEAGTQVAETGYNPDGRASPDLLDHAERLIFEIAEQSGRNRRGFQSVRDVLPDVVDRIDTLYHQDSDVTGLATGFTDLDRMTSGLQAGDLVIVAGRPSMGKCVVEGTRVLDPQTGDRRPIEELVHRREGRLLTLGEDFRLHASAPSDYLDDGVKPVFRVVTALGREIETTLTHPFLTGDGWQPLSQIQPGERVAVPRALPVFGSEDMPEHEVRLLAYFIADGGTTQANPAFTNGNARLRQDFRQAVDAFGGVRVRSVAAAGRTPTLRVVADATAVRRARCTLATRLRARLHELGVSARWLAAAVGVAPATVSYWLQGRNLPNATAFGALTACLQLPEEALLPEGYAGAGRNARNGVSLWLERHGLRGVTAPCKRLPECVFRLPQSQLACFLNRLFACDGSLFVQNGGQSLLSYATSSEALARDVQHLLLRFGILARLRRKRVRYREEERAAFELVVSHRESLERFLERIGIFGKEERVEQARSLLARRRAHSNTDSLPESVGRYVLARKGGRTWRELYAAAGRELPAGFNPHLSAGSQRLLSRRRALELAGLLDDDYLVRHGTSDLYWDRIVSIEYTGHKRVYDLTVPETHCFVADDILVHNTTFAMNIAEAAALHQDGPPVAVFSMEMPADALAMRMLSSLGRVELQKIRSGRLADEDWPRLTSTMNLLSQARLFIDDTPGLTPTEMRARCRRLKREHDLGLVLVDYLQLMQLPGYKENRAMEISEISRSLKGMAKELGVPVMVLSQLNRSLEQRPNKRPVMSDLRESGAIEQDADVIVFIYRDEVYNEDSPDKGTAEIIIGKQRNGPVGTLRLTFLGQYTRFENYIHDGYGGEGWT